MPTRRAQDIYMALYPLTTGDTHGTIPAVTTVVII